MPSSALILAIVIDAIRNMTALTRCDVMPHEVWDAAMSAMVICLKKGVQ